MDSFPDITMNPAVLDKAAVLADSIVKILLDAPEGSNEIDLGQSVSSTQTSDSLWSDSGSCCTASTDGASSMNDSSIQGSIYSFSQEETARSPAGFVMQELGRISQEGSIPHPVKAKDHPDLFHQCTAEERKYYDNDAIKAVAGREIDKLRCWHGQGRPLMTSDDFGFTLLHMACRRGFFDVVAFLVLEAGVSLWVKDEQGKTPLHFACHAMNPLFELVDLVIQQDQQDLLLVTDNRGSMPLDYAPRKTWGLWISFFQEKDFQSIMPRRLIFFASQNYNTKKLPSFLQDIDRILMEYSAKKAKKKKKKKKGKSGDDESKRTFLKLKRKIAKSIIQNMQSNSVDDPSNSIGDLSFLADLSSLPPDILLMTLQMQRRLNQKIGFAGMEPVMEQSDSLDYQLDIGEPTSSVDGGEGRIESLKQLEELKIRYIETSVDMKIALEVKGQVYVAHAAQEKCDVLASEIRQLKFGLNSGEAPAL